MVNILIKEFCFELKPITKNKTHFECIIKSNFKYFIGVCNVDP